MVREREYAITIILCKIEFMIVQLVFKFNINKTLY